MDKKYNELFTPWKIRDLEIKNRIVMCPMGGTSLFGWMKKSSFNKESAEFFMDIAKNNVGLIIPGIAPLKDLMFGGWLYKNKKAFKKLKVFMEELHKTGAKLFVQLTAGFGRSFAITTPLVPFLKHKWMGKIMKPIMDVSYICASPSEVESRWAEGVKCREISKEEIEHIIYAFGETSRMLKEAGVDGVEVHAVHEGYLIDQFTLKYLNKREDEYGGSFENRYRFAVEIVKEIKSKCGENYPVSLRYSVESKTKDLCYGAMPGEKYAEVGRDIKESEKAAKYLEKAGYDMLNCDNGTYDAWYWAHPPAYMPVNCNLDDVEKIKKVVNIPVVCAGRMVPADGATAIREGKIDAMGVARQFLVDKTWITKLMNGNEKDIQPCICCHNGCFAMAHYKGVANDESLHEAKHMARCALNPQTMNGHKFNLKRAKKVKNVAVIGGGIAGMEVARILTLRGHNVTIYEKTDTLGGVFIPASNFDFKENDRMLIDWYRNQIEALGIKVEYNSDIRNIKTLQADAVVIATGARAKSVNIPGGEDIVDAIDYLNGCAVGNNVLIIGGGLTGCEIAYDLHRKGKKPIIVESKNDIMAVRGLCLANSSYLRDYFRTHNIPIYLNKTVRKIDGKTITIGEKKKTESVFADSVILAIGYNPAPIAKKSKNVYIVGDADRVGNLRTVVWKAWEVAMKI